MLSIKNLSFIITLLSITSVQCKPLKESSEVEGLYIPNKPVHKSSGHVACGKRHCILPRDVPKLIRRGFRGPNSEKSNGGNQGRVIKIGEGKEDEDKGKPLFPGEDGVPDAPRPNFDF